MKANYPYVDCEDHGRQLGYAVCKHVTKGQRIFAYIDPATKTAAGAITCGEGPHDDPDELDLLCEAHCIEALGMSIEQAMKKLKARIQ
jgi:hypothetical protein